MRRVLGLRQDHPFLQAFTTKAAQDQTWLLFFLAQYTLYFDKTGVTHEILQPTAKLTQGVLRRGNKGDFSSLLFPQKE